MSEITHELTQEQARLQWVKSLRPLLIRDLSALYMQSDLDSACAILNTQLPDTLKPQYRVLLPFVHTSAHSRADTLNAYDLYHNVLHAVACFNSYLAEPEVKKAEILHHAGMWFSARWIETQAVLKKYRKLRQSTKANSVQQREIFQLLEAGISAYALEMSGKYPRKAVESLSSRRNKLIPRKQKIIKF
jgi:hypothetical protein